MEPKIRFEKLKTAAEDFRFDHAVPPTRYFRSCLEVVRMADTYYDEGNLENAYVLYLKFLVLSLEKLPTHPLLPSVPKAEIQRNRDIAKGVFPKVEKLKGLLTKQFEEDFEKWKQEQEKKRQEDEKRKQEEEKRKKQLETEKERGKRNHEAAPSPHLPYPSPTVIAPVRAPDSVAYGELDKVINNDLKDNLKERELVAGARPEFDRALKPSAPPPDVDWDLRLKAIVLCPTIANRFVEIAEKNTLRNIETCGILAGKLSQNSFICTHLILPKQSGTSESCTTQNEEEIFDVQDKNHLLTLGWIHTHPTQTAFLSSVDLHTQCGYQIMMPEALAIVCAPKFDEVGYFRLTESGVEEVANCRLSGFHPHSANPPTFQEASHIRFDSNLRLTVIDLRK